MCWDFRVTKHEGCQLYYAATGGFVSLVKSTEDGDRQNLHHLPIVDVTFCAQDMNNKSCLCVFITVFYRMSNGVVVLCEVVFASSQSRIFFTF